MGSAILRDSMDTEQIRSDVEHRWDTSIVPALERYIAIPNQSPLFDPNWKQNGHMNAAVDLARRWAEQQQIKGMTIEVLQSEDRTPLIYIEVDGEKSSTVLMYG